jgi:hypothetical protein
MMEIFIPHNVPSSKNSKQFTGKYLVHSKTVKKYLQKLGIKNYSARKKQVEVYVKLVNLFEVYTRGLQEVIQQLPKPALIEFHFVRDSKRKFDFHNAVQLPLDLMTAHDIIDDDDMDNIIPVAYKKQDKWYTVDKKNAGVYIRVGELIC